MGALFSDTKFSDPNAASRGKAPLPPPPSGPISFLDADPSEGPPPPSRSKPKRPTGVRFDAELELSELDDRDRPGSTWPGQGRELSRSHLILRTRRMCYQNRRIAIAIHLIDESPVPLLGRVATCEYDGDGLYRVELELIPIPVRSEIAAWMAERTQRH